jgi:hypothetical protein
MKRISLVFMAALSIAVFGCKKKGDDCDVAIQRSMELSKADMQKMPGVDDKMLDKMKDVGLARCREDKWSAEALKCMTDAKTEKDSQACYGKLSGEQQAKMNNAAMELMKPPAGVGSAAPPAGSAAGSAGSVTPPG